MIKRVHAFDLKSKIIELSDGNIGLVSTIRKLPWGFSTVPPYILGGTNCCLGVTSHPAGTDCWNTDAYVAEIDPNTLAKVWEKDFNSEDDIPSNNNSSDFRTASDGGGDPKHQECVYGISEGPNHSIIISGNSSGNVDDNYMVKIQPWK